MRKRLIEKFTKCKEGSLGYTLTELLVVIGIIAIVCAIAIPSVVSISKSLRFAQRNDYAKSIFMAAQANLTEMRADGGLAPLQRAGLDSLPVQEELCGFPVEDWSPEYVYTSSETSQQLTYALVLPVGSVDAALRDKQVIIEYNPLTGNVYSVFYSEEKDQNILQDYRDGKLPRNGEGDEKLRKEMMLGYYDGSGLSSAELEIERTEARITFENGEEGIVTVHIPMPDLYVGHHEEFMKGLEVKLTITGELNDGEIANILVKQNGSKGDNCKLATDGKTVEVTYVLDSLANRMSFANLASSTRPDPNAVLTQNTGNTSLTAIMDEGEFRILPGENVTLKAEVTFQAANDRPNVAVQNAQLGGVNPMFGFLTENLTGGGYTLTIENGRNLQNLNAIAPSVANQITAVVFTQDIYWNQTVAYYNQNYPQAGGYKNNPDEAPARALPYFVPIHNENLFGTARFVYLDGSEEEQNLLENILSRLIGSDFKRSERVPTLTDELDTQDGAGGKTIAENHARIDGGGHAVYYLNINSNVYQVPNEGDAAKEGKFYATGDRQVIDYYFTGLFGYINTPISDLSVVNPIIKGHDFVDEQKTEIKNVQIGTSIIGRPQYGDREVNVSTYSNPATGALVGACGYNTYLYNCSVYLDTKAAGFNWNAVDHGAHVAQKNFTAAGDQDWYGVSGAGAVGGLVGYAKSHKTTSGELGDNANVLAFNRCFAAVPVSGHMRGDDYDYDKNLYNGETGPDKDFGYSNGVGGLVGNAQLTNFYNCYASGNIRVDNTYCQTTNYGADTLQTVFGLGGNGRLSMGGGGFVGTSHGTRFTNCFASGNVTRTSGTGTMANAGGFVGMMCYDETLAYGHHGGNTSAVVAQHTVFESCYAVGMCVDGSGNYLESFAGGTGTISVGYGTIKSYYNPDYYRLFAPYYVVDATDPLYQTHYIFKDSYYLSQYSGNANVSQDQSKKCANPIGYSDLVNLHLKYGDANWIQNNIDQLKNYPIDLQIIRSVYNTTKDYLTSISIWQFIWDLDDMWDILTKSDPIYEFYFKIYNFLAERDIRPTNPGLEGSYFNRYSEGFPSLPWETPMERNTHYYGEATAGMVYPFPKLNNMDYYGTWPAEPLTGGLAYYEAYENTDGSVTYGYYFDRADTSSLRSAEETLVLHDGYAVFSGTKKDTIYIYNADGQLISGALRPAENSVTLSSPYSPDNSSYYVTRIPDDVLAKLTPGGEGFYSAIRIQVSNDSGTANYWALFNPNTGISQVNNVQFNGNSIVYRENPEDVLIRTARQLNAITSTKMQNVWNDPDVTFIQQLHINAATYDWNNDGNVLNETIPVPGSIGSETKPFCATYSGSAGYVDQARIEGFNLENAIFGNIGTFTKTTQTTDETTGETTTTTTILQGKVEDLSILIQGGENVTIGGENAQYAAVLAAVSSGIIDNVDIRITGALKLEANTAAGLLAGYISGTEADRAAVTGCDITADSLTVNAINAGAVIGQAEYCDIRQGVDSENLADDLTLTLNNTLTLKGTDVGAFLGASGDLNGDKTIGEVNVDGLTITLKGITAEARRLGALAGTLDTGSIKNLNVTLDNAYSVTHNTEKTVIAGVAAVAKNALVQSVTVNVKGSLTGDTAAGVFGTAENLTVQTTEVTVSGTITGTQAAAGMAASIEGGEFSSGATVYLNGTIKAEGTEKVTTEDTTDEEGNVIPGTTTTEPSGRAAGFAVEVHGQVETGLVIAENKGTITGNAEAAGFACEISAQVTGTRVAGNLAISGGKKAAGFAVKIAGSDLTINTNGVTPALENTTAGYLGKSNANLTVKGDTAAMFAVEIGSGVSVRNCYALGTVTGKAVSGFADVNGGTIEGCSANVTLSGGYAFVRENTGAISTSYGWYGDGSAENGTTTAAIETGSVVSSYFVDIDVPVTEDCKSADIYNSKKEHRTDSPLKLTAKELNGETGSRWFAAGTYSQYPYGKLVPKDYPYPMLRVHYGDWATPPQYAFGVLYYEQYADGWKLQIVDLSDPAVTVEDAPLNRTDNFNNDGKILDAGYAVFYKTEGDDLPVKITDATLGDLLDIRISDKAAYNVRKLKPAKATVTVTEILAYPEKDENGNEITTGKEAKIGAWYAHEFGTVTAHVVRTEGQLAMIAQTEAGNGGKGTYSQTHDIVLGDNTNFTTISNGFSGTYNGNGRYIQKSGTTNTWMNGVSGTVENLELVLGDLNASFFGNVSGNVSLTQVSVDSLGANGRLVTNLTGSLEFTHTITEDDLNPYHIQVGGQLSGMLIENVSGTLDCDVIQVGGDLTGKVIGTANAGITGLEVQAQSIIGTGAVIGTVAKDQAVSMSLTCSGEVSGSVVDNVNGSFTLNNNPGFGTVSGSLFDSVSGTVTLSSGIKVDTLSGSLIAASSGTVNTNAVNVGTLSGSLVNTVSGGTVSTGTISVTTLDGALVQTMGVVNTNNTVSGGTVNTGAITVTTLNASLVTTFNGGTMNGNNSQITVTNGIAVPVFTDVLGGTVQNYVVSGDVTLGGNAKGALVNTNNGTLSGLKLAEGDVMVQSSENATIGVLVGTNSGKLTDCVVDGADVTITGEKGKTLTFGGLVGENSGTISGTTEVEANITYIQPIDGNTDKATIGGLVGKMSGGSMTNAYVTGSIDLTNKEQIEAAAAIAEAEAQGVELLEELNPAPIQSNRSYIIGGAVGNLFAGGASSTEANVIVVPAWKGAVQVANANTFGTSGVTNQGPVGMFAGFAGAVTIENCASTETTNETFQFLGEAMIGEVSYQDGTWVSTVKADSILSYSDSPYCNGNVYTSADSSDITVTGKTSADKYTGIVTNLAGEEGCTFYLNGVQHYQSYGNNMNIYTKADTAQNGYKLTQVAGTLNQVGTPRVKDVKDADSTNGFVDSPYYVKIGGQYYRLGVKVESRWIFVTVRDYYFAWYTDNGTYEQIGYVTGTTPGYTRSLGDNDVKWTHKPEAYYTLTTPTSLDTSKQYLVVSGSEAFASTGNVNDGVVTVPFAATFKQRDSMYNAIWNLSINGGKHTWTTVAHGLVFEEANPILQIPGKFTSPVVKYTIGGAVCDLYIVEIDPALAYYKVVFTYAAGDADIREYITCTPVKSTTNLTETDLPGETGEAPTAEDGNNN